MRRPFHRTGLTRRPSFLRGEAGSMTIFGLFIFVIILTVGGIAVDVMRYEYKRVTLQNTADRAVLAAGSLRQPNDPEEVVREYFRREGLEQYVTSVRVEEGLNFRRVNVQTSDTSPTMFMKFLGINELTMTPVSASEERYSKVEVSLVLDLSNSMNNENRIQNLRIAGQDFIDTLFDNAEPGQVSVSVIPYTGQVNLGPDLSRYFNISPRLTQSQCVDFPPASYNSISITPGSSFVGSGHFDPWHTTSTPQMFFCPTHTGARGEVVTFSGDPVFLRNRIGNLMADGNTSIEIGVKWGAALLDPAMRPVITGLVNEGRIADDFAGRPLAYDDPDALKVMVIMTDGENFEQWMISDAFKSGPSPVVRHNTNGRLSVFHATRSESTKWYYPRDGSWNNRPEGASRSVSGPNAADLGPNTRLTWDQVWTLHTVRWVASNLYPTNATRGNRSASQWIDTVLSRRSAADKNVHLRNICDTVKARDIPIFTVAFEAPPVGVASMQMCATSASHFFDVDGADIRGAFRAIAGTINRLRLTQ